MHLHRCDIHYSYCDTIYMILFTILGRKRGPFRCAVHLVRARGNRKIGNKAGYTAISRSWLAEKQKRHGPTNGRTNGRTNRRTNGQTDTRSYRVASSRLKIKERGRAREKERKNKERGEYRRRVKGRERGSQIYPRYSVFRHRALAIICEKNGD